MTFTIVIRRSAKSDIDAAHAWYDSEQPGLGTELLDAFSDTFKRIASRPLRYPLAVGDARRALVQRFPYSVYFPIRGNEVRILAVVHQRRDPRTVTRRLGGG